MTIMTRAFRSMPQGSTSIASAAGLAAMETNSTELAEGQAHLLEKRREPGKPERASPRQKQGSSAGDIGSRASARALGRTAPEQPVQEQDSYHAALEEAKEAERECEELLPPHLTDEDLAELGPATSNAKIPTSNPLDRWGLEALTDFGNASRLVKMYGRIIRRTRDSEKWYVYESGRWDNRDQSKIFHYAGLTVRSIAGEIQEVDDKEARVDILKWARTSESAKSMRAMVHLAASNEDIKIYQDELDADPFLLNCRNGTVDLRTGKLLPHDPDNLCSKQCPCDYDQEAHNAEFDAFVLDFVDGNRQLLDYLQRALGYTAIGKYNIRRFFYVYGRSGSGKTTFVESMAASLGDYAVPADKETFLLSKQSGARARQDIAELESTRMVIATEIPERARFDTAFMKQYTGSDSLTARALYSKYRSIKRRGKPWISGNYLPSSSSDDEAFFTRADIILANNQRLGPDGKTPRVNPDLLSIFTDPHGAQKAIFAFIVEGALIYQRDGLNPPDIVRYETAEYRRAQNPLTPWIDAYCETSCSDLSSYSTAAALRASYEAYVTEEFGRFGKPLTQQAFGKYLRQLGFIKDRARVGGTTSNAVAIWRGIRVKQEEQCEEQVE
jgi:putative DNA primase/helicase